MDCGQVQDLLSGYRDGMSPPAEASRIEVHLEQCSACRAAYDALRLDHHKLTQAFQQHRQAAATLAERVNRGLQERTGSRRGFGWLPLALAAAAGFLIAVGLFQPWRRTREVVVITKPNDITPANSRLLLTVAKEPIRILTPGTDEWKPLRAGERFEVGCTVRTAPDLRCEIVSDDESEIRVNGGSELRFVGARQLELISGQIMAHVAKAPQAFEVQIADARVTALGTQFDVSRNRDESLLLVLEGSTRIDGVGPSQVVSNGELAKIVEGRVTAKNTFDPLLLMLTTRWVNEILVMKGRDNPELASRIDHIMAQLGQVKNDYLQEQEIRSLGDRCVLPLARYLQSPLCEGENLRFRRVTSARILADLAQPWAIPELLHLLESNDPEVRYHAAKGLERLTGDTQGRRPEDWRRNPPDAMKPTLQAWRDWWSQNQQRIPGAP